MNFISSPYYIKGEYHFLMGYSDPFGWQQLQATFFRLRAGFMTTFRDSGKGRFIHQPEKMRDFIRSDNHEGYVP